MTNKLKKKFLDYLQSKSAFYIYIKTYRDRHLSINPKEFTDYLCQTDPRLVITGAFTFPDSQLSYYDRKYWMKIHEGWMALLEKDSQEDGHRGISINVTETTKTRTSKNVVIGSKDFCSKLSKLLGIKTDYTLLDCRIFSQSANIIVFSINTKL